MGRNARLLVVAVVLAACGSSPAGEPTTTLPEAATSSSQPTPGTSTPETTPTTAPSSAPVDMVETAIAELAARLDIDPESIRLIESGEVTWPDASLGCPRPDELYAQVETDGFRVVLAYEDRVYAYHAGDDTDPFLCPSEERDGGREFIPPPGFDS